MLSNENFILAPLEIKKARKKCCNFAGNQYFSLGFGLALEQDSAEIDYIWWGGAANTLFWADPKTNVVGLFLTQHFPVAYNIMDTLEETVDRAKL